MSAKLTVQLVTWNGEKYIPFLFESLKKQSFDNWELRILDNASSDATAEMIKNEIENETQIKIKNGSVPVCFETLDENLGFAGGHNYLYQKTKNAESKYLLLLNQDMYLEPDCFEQMVAFLDEHEDVAVVSPRLMRWDFGKIQDTRNKKETRNNPQNTKYYIQNTYSDEIDSLGLKVLRNRRVVEKYTGKHWSHVKPKMRMSFREEPAYRQAGAWRGESALEVFGVSGAFPMFCKEALGDVAFPNGNFFDNSYGSYKEDVDLAFRLRSYGARAYVLLDTVAYHDRSAMHSDETSDTAAAKNKQSQSSWVKYHSYKNHLMTLYKNEYGQNLVLDFFPILWYEAKKFVWLLLFDRAVLKGLREIWKERKGLRARRKHITHMRDVSARTIRAWWIL